MCYIIVKYYIIKYNRTMEIKMDLNGKTNKSVNLTKVMIEKLTNYNKRTGTTFSEIVEESLNMYFDALNRGNEIAIETLGVENMDNSILIPISLYIKVNGIVPAQLYNLEKQGKVQIRTLTQSNSSNSKSRFVILTEKNPEFFKSKIAMMDLEIEGIKNRLLILEKNE